MTKRKRWVRHATEGLVILGSILLAFGIQAWWDGHRDKAARREFMVAICEDIVSDRASLQQYVEFNRGGSLVRGRFFNASVQELTGLSDDEARQVMGSLQRISIFEPKPNAAQASDLSSLEDPKTRELLVTWRSLLADFDENAKLHWSSLVETYRAGGVGYMANQLNGVMEWRIPEGLEPVQSQLAQLRRNDEFMAAELRLQLLLTYTVDKASPVIEAADDILEGPCSHG